MITREIAVVQTQGQQYKPTIIEWNGQKMLRSHSFLKAIDEIINVSEKVDAFRIGILGSTHSGKTTVAKAISHAFHKRSKIPFAVRHFEKDELINLKDTLSNLKPANYILTFDDVSFLSAHANKKQLDELKSTFTTIRHIPGGEDVKIISILPHHYSKSLDPYLRQAEFKFVTTISGKTELNNMIQEFGEQNASKIGLFQHLHSTTIRSNIFRFRLGNSNGKDSFFTYRYRDPFIPCLFWNSDSLRFIVSPTRQFIDKECTICENGENKNVVSDVDVNILIQQLQDSVGERILKSAVKARLLTQGINTYSKSITAAIKKIDQILQTRKISLKELGEKIGLDETGQTKIAKAFLPILEENDSKA